MKRPPVSALQLERLVAEIEQQLYACGDSEIASAKIGELVMDRLMELNEVAYVRFASVYRRFKDIAGFEKELSHIKQYTDQKKRLMVRRAGSPHETLTTCIVRSEGL